jgi:hypothetical protein
MDLHTNPGGKGLRRNELHQATQGEKDKPSKFGMKLRRLAAHAYPDGALPETVLVQLFQKGLEDIDTQRFVGLQEPDTLEEAVRHASAFEAYGAKGSWKKPRSVNSVNERGTDSNLASELADLKLKYEQLQRQLPKPKVGLNHPLLEYG